MKNVIKRSMAVITCALLGINFSGCNTSASNQKAKSEGINIPATKGFLPYSWEACYKLKRITNVERKELGIDAIGKYEIKEYPNKELAKGKEIFKNEKGRLATFLVLIEDYTIIEYLVSYNPAGDVIDCIPIGENQIYRSDEESSTIEGNKIKVTCRWGEPGEWGEGIGQIYTVTDDLHFLPFAWPSSSYPCEIPFMTDEASGTEDYGTDNNTVLYCGIESIVCTGASGNQYTFEIKGKAKQDCKSLTAAQRTFMLEPVNKEWKSAGETLKVEMPAIRENESFEIKVKGLTKGKADEKIFVKFKIKR